ncbi:MAG: hypothetical protein AB1345_14955 [Chloroflexota bacterium]
MVTQRKAMVIWIAFMVITALACGSFAPPESCGENIGGTADEVKFAQYFESMELVNQSTGQPGQEGEEGMEFAKGDTLAIRVASKSEVAVRACVQSRTGGGKIPFDQTQTLSQGQGTFSIGTLEPGSYVIRVIVNDTLVKNFPFVVK